MRHRTPSDALGAESRDRGGQDHGDGDDDRLRVLQPNDPESYYKSREIVPEDMLLDLGKVKIAITNYHGFKKKDELPLNKVQQAALRTTPKPESDGAMIRRVAGELMGLKNIVVLNDEAHHCYRERPPMPGEALKGDELAEAKENNEAARLWISGIEAIKRELGVSMVYDLSAPPFFLRGSGYREGSPFGWVMNDFSLMDAIESGIIKLPRVLVMDNVPGGDTPMFRNLWDHIGGNLPKKGRGNAKGLDPQKLPTPLLTAIDALYGHYEKTHALWREAEIDADAWGSLKRTRSRPFPKPASGKVAVKAINHLGDKVMKVVAVS